MGTKVDQETALNLMWAAKQSYKDCFMWATVKEETEATDWKDLPSGWKGTPYKIPAGTRILVTVVSRLGDVGITDKNIKKLCHGYSARVMPEALTDWETTE